ncbi:hypothetical protein [Methanoplanus endosymbiosus]|uniref:Uncharacterized protein n=1 Tax=Methanoplanus endosymbiosus TaxID=33865 RepID=A0A9E7PRJ8_9EURY|nr:hypothetical protein [Methanoplanus endosymbiosus]UUX93741.1 hypothetical protein L6E24_06400 [Methanoplanus endosymbiosus]
METINNKKHVSNAHQITLQSAILEDNVPIDEKLETAEVYSKAYNIAAGDYFKKKTTLKNSIAEILMKRNNLVYGSVAVAVLSLIVIFILFFNNVPATIIWGIPPVVILIDIITANHLHSKYTQMYESKNDELDRLKPSGKVLGLSKVYHQYFIIPHGNSSMLFDSKNLGTNEKISVKYIDGSKLTYAVNRLNNEIDNYSDFFSEKHSINEIKLYSPDAIKNKNIDIKIQDSLQSINSVMEDTNSEDFEFNIHRPSGTSAELIKKLLFNVKVNNDPLINLKSENKNKDFKAIPPDITIEGVIKNIEGIIRIEKEAKEGESIDIINKCKNRFSAIDKITAQMSINQNNITNHCNNIKSYIESLSTIALCPECIKKYEEEHESYNIRNIIEQRLEYTKTELKNMNIDSGISFLDSEMEILDDFGLILPNSLLYGEYIEKDLLDVHHEDGKLKITANCDNHTQNENISIFCSSHVFCRPAMSVFNELKQPILNLAENMDSELQLSGANMRNERLSLAPYHNIYKELEQQYKEIEIRKEMNNEFLRVIRGI